jgi:ribonuclease HI
MEKRSKERVPSIEIYTDGSLKKTGDMTFGGWGFIVIKNNEVIYFEDGNEYHTTNQRMELTAILKALEYIKDHRRVSEKVIIYSDSAYAVNCYLKEWYMNWQTNGWLNANGQEVANKDLWFEIVPFFENFWYDFRKVKGHAGEYWNEKCDELAQKSAEKLKRNWRGTKNL